MADVVLPFLLPLHSIRINDPSPLGAGGFGAVWRANWQGREVAIKVRVACACPQLFFHYHIVPLQLFLWVSVLRFLFVTLAGAQGVPKYTIGLGKGNDFGELERRPTSICCSLPISLSPHVLWRVLVRVAPGVGAPCGG